MPRITGTKVIRQDGGFVAVVSLTDGTVSTPMKAPIRDQYMAAFRDQGYIVLTETGPVYKRGGRDD